ncbi:MAG: hypothetical protein KC457_11835, partial [Myxococcales bacterium]|nr:hypothetical protein [Myxococcales bacterium]
NGDGAVEYSELGAFVSAANSGVDDPSARLEVAVRPPRGDERAPILIHDHIEKQRVMLLAGAVAGRYSFEDGRGVRLADLNHAPGQPAYLRLPAGPIYIYRHDQSGARVAEAKLAATSTGIVDLVALNFEDSSEDVGARGPLDDALRAGLFEVRYGQGYYSGYTDTQKLLAVRDPDWEVRIWQRDPETGEMIEVTRVQGQGAAPGVEQESEDELEEVVITEIEIDEDCDYCWDKTWLSIGVGAEFNPLEPSGRIRHPDQRVVANQFKGFDDQGFPSALRGVDFRMGAFSGRKPTDYPFAEGYFRSGYTEGHAVFLPRNDVDGFDIGNATSLDYMTVPLFFGGNFYFPQRWPVRPYAGLGAGFDVLRVRYERYMMEDLVDVSLRIGFELHAGIDIRLTNYLTLFGEVRQLWSAKRRVSKAPDFSNEGFTIVTGIRFGIPVGRGASAGGRGNGETHTRTKKVHVVETRKPAPKTTTVVKVPGPVPPPPPPAPGEPAPVAPAPVVSPAPVAPAASPTPAASPAPVLPEAISPQPLEGPRVELPPAEGG